MALTNATSADRREHGGAPRASGNRPRRPRWRRPLGGEPALERERGGVLGRRRSSCSVKRRSARSFPRARGAVGEVSGQRTRERDVEPSALIVEQV